MVLRALLQDEEHFYCKWEEIKSGACPPQRSIFGMCRQTVGLPYVRQNGIKGDKNHNCPSHGNEKMLFVLLIYLIFDSNSPDNRSAACTLRAERTDSL